MISPSREYEVKVIYDVEARTLTTCGIVFKVNNFIRTNKDGTRSLDKKSELVFPVLKDATHNGEYDYKRPVMPGHFPKGHWKITSLEYTDNPTFAPVKIKTSAHQPLKVWTIDPDGSYGHETEETVEDWAYYFHASWSRTSQGCGILETQKAALKLAKQCETAFVKGETIFLEVV